MGEELQQIQARHGFPVAEMALCGEAEPVAPPRVTASVGVRRTLSNLPGELTSFVGRRGELAELKKLLTTYPLVTVTGIGGVGKTRLALRAAATFDVRPGTDRQRGASVAQIVDSTPRQSSTAAVALVNVAGLGRCQIPTAARRGEHQRVGWTPVDFGC